MALAPVLMLTLPEEWQPLADVAILIGAGSPFMSYFAARGARLHTSSSGVLPNWIGWLAFGVGAGVASAMALPSLMGDPVGGEEEEKGWTTPEYVAVAGLAVAYLGSNTVFGLNLFSSSSSEAASENLPSSSFVVSPTQRGGMWAGYVLAW